MTAGEDTPQRPLIDAEGVQRLAGQAPIALVDATWFPPWTAGVGSGQAAFEAAHIPGAVFLDIEAVSDPDCDLPHTLPRPDDLAAHLGILGLSANTPVVVYDQNRFCASARAWWMLRVAGHPDVRVLDGGLTAWQASGGAVESGLSLPTAAGFAATGRRDLVASLDDMQAAVEQGHVTILDARPADRFEGRAPEPRPDLPSGHMPGAANVPASALIDEDGRMRPRDALVRILAPKAGAGPVVTTCGSGVTACILALAMVEAGLGDPKVYDGSWSEWARDPDRPRLNGPA